FTEDELTKAAASYMPMTVSGITVSDPVVRLTPGRFTLTATGRAFFVSGPIVVVAAPVLSGGRVIARVDSATLAGIALPDSAKAELAREQAREAEREIAAGRYRGALHGIPVAVKDLFATAGIRTTAGSRILRDWIPEADATVVRQLRDAGAVLVGKLNMHEFAYGISSVN